MGAELTTVKALKKRLIDGSLGVNDWTENNFANELSNILTMY